MRKRVLFFLFVMLVSVELLSASFFKPKFAPVLGGGGAKGLAHIPIIQELDRRGIVPDMVLGTSAGALIGGLYAAGHDGDELEEIVTENDIMNYIFHLYAVRPRELIPSPFTDFETNLLTVEFGTTGFGAANAILDDQYINAFLRRYIAKVMEVEDFDDLPIAFRAIGTDITNNRKVVFDSGSLFEALRASMAIPLVFAPVQLEDGSWIMDGGTEDNLPIDVARDLGADIVLAVDVADAGRVHPDSVPDMHTLSGAFTGFTDYLSRPAVLAQYENADWVIVPDVGTFSALDFGSKSTEELLEAGREAVAENADVFDELERRLAPYKDDMEYTHYSELPTPVIEKVLPNGVPASYRETLVSFEGRPMDYETISEFEAFLDDIRTHEGLKSVTYDVVDGIITVYTTPFPTMSGNISLGLSGGIGVRYDGTDIFFVYDPEFTLSGSISLLPNLGLEYGIVVDEGIMIEGGLVLPFMQSLFLYGDLSLKYGQQSYLSIPGTRAYNFGNDAGVTLRFGLAYIYRDKIRLDLIGGVDYTYISGKNSSSLSLGTSHDVYPYGGLGFVYDDYLGTDAADNGLEMSLALSVGGDFPDTSLAYSMVFDIYGAFGPTDFLKFIVDAEVSTIRRPWDLAAAYRATKTGLISPDHIYVMGGVRLPLPASTYVDAGIYFESFDKDGAREKDSSWSTGQLIPFSLLDTIELGGYLSGGIITSFGRIGGELFLSMHPRVSFMITIE